MDGLIIRVGVLAGLASAGVLVTFATIAITSWRRDRRTRRAPVVPIRPPITRGESLDAARRILDVAVCKRCRGWVPTASLARHDRACARRTARESALVDQFLREMGMAEPDPVDVANAAHDELGGRRDEQDGRA